MVEDGNGGGSESEKIKVSGKKKKCSTAGSKTSSRGGKKGRKIITVDMNVYGILSEIRKEMAERLGGPITFNMVIQSLIHDRIDLKNVKAELSALKSEMEDMQNFVRNMLKLALEKDAKRMDIIPAAHIIPVTQPYSASANPPSPPVSVTPPPSLGSSPPPPFNSSPVRNISPSAVPPSIPKYTPPNTGNIKKDYITEIKQIFRGKILRPSEVIKITRPKHINGKIHSIDGTTGRLVGSGAESSASFSYGAERNSTEISPEKIPNPGDAVTEEKSARPTGEKKVKKTSPTSRKYKKKKRTSAKSSRSGEKPGKRSGSKK